MDFKEKIMDEATKARIVREESAKFLDEGFGQLDLSGSPGLQPLPPEDNALEDRHGFSRVITTGTNGLKAFIENPDSESLNRLAAETGDGELADKLKEDREEQEAIKFVQSHPNYYRDEDGDNYEKLRSWLEERNLPFTAENLDIAFKTLCRLGEMKMSPGTPKALSQREQLHIISLAQNGQLADAIRQYLTYALPDAEENWTDSTDFLSDPATLNVRNRAVEFTWFHSRAIENSPDWAAFQKRYVRHRPIRTIADLDNAYAKFLEEQKSQFRNRLLTGDATLANASTQQQDIEDLDDEAVADLYRRTAREHARSAPRQAGVLV
jgi:hypothetical protein